MIVDTSALAAIVFQEEAHDRLLAALSHPQTKAGIGTPTVAELGLVLSARLGTDARSLVGDLLEHLDITQVPFTESHWRLAIEAYWRYGRGRHPAGLNFGDCLTYAVASLAHQPLLFTGEDFAATDLAAVDW